MTSSIDKPHWAIRYSAIAFLLLVLWQCFGVVSHIRTLPQLYSGFGAELPATTVLVLKYYWVGCAVLAAASIGSTGFLILRSRGKPSHFKVAYLVSLAALVGAFVWSGFVTAAVFDPVLSLGNEL